MYTERDKVARGKTYVMERQIKQSNKSKNLAFIKIHHLVSEMPYNKEMKEEKYQDYP